MEIRDVLKQIRAELGINQAELSNALHISYATVNRWENGKTYPNRSILAALELLIQKHPVSDLCKDNLKSAIQKTNQNRIRKNKEKLYSVEHASLSQLIEDASFPIYVCDLETDEILYANHKAQEILGDADLVGQPCYRTLMNNDKTCSFCHKEELREDCFTSYHAFRPRDNQYYLVQGKLVTWQGRKAQVRYFLDIKEHQGTTVKNHMAQFFSEETLASSLFNLTDGALLQVFKDQEKLKPCLASLSMDELLKVISANVFSELDKQNVESRGKWNENSRKAWNGLRNDWDF